MAVVHIMRVDQHQWIKSSDPLQQGTVRAVEAGYKNARSKTKREKRNVSVAIGCLFILLTKLKQTWLEEKKPSERRRRSRRSKKRVRLQVAGRVMLRWHVLVLG